MAVIRRQTVYRCFNTQPPEGGWNRVTAKQHPIKCFNTQPPEGGWDTVLTRIDRKRVSTHSRPKAAGATLLLTFRASFPFQHTAARRRLGEHVSLARCADAVSTHSRPKAAGKRAANPNTTDSVSTHSRPKAAGQGFHKLQVVRFVSTHSRPKAAGFRRA